MKKILLNGKLMQKNPHIYMKKILKFPDYYGENLDALFDCLGDIGEKTEIILSNSKNVDESIITTFEDASNENPNLTFKLK
jgi:ribonuclease inhibitor